MEISGSVLVELGCALVALVGVISWRKRARGRTISPTLDGDSSAQSVPDSETDSLQPGSRVGPYVIEHLLGEGGMAEVFKARGPDDSRGPVALKVLKPEISRDPQFKLRFEREVKLCKDLDHPNIIALFDWGEFEGRLYLALEYVEGRLLTDCVSSGGMPLSEVEPILDGLISGLEYAHLRGIVHRDLKPDNLMVSGSGRLKIMDFGLARAQDGDKVTKTGDSMGTPAYVAPEQITGATPTSAADQYSLGVILYEMLTGLRPFQEKNPLKMLMQHMTEAPPDPVLLKPDLPVSCAQIVLRMLEKSPEKRFDSLKDIAAGVRAAREGSDWSMPVCSLEPGVTEPSLVEITTNVNDIDDGDTMGFQVR